MALLGIGQLAGAAAVVLLTAWPCASRAMDDIRSLAARAAGIGPNRSAILATYADVRGDYDGDGETDRATLCQLAEGGGELLSPVLLIVRLSTRQSQVEVLFPPAREFQDLEILPGVISYATTEPLNCEPDCPTVLARWRVVPDGERLRVVPADASASLMVQEGFPGGGGDPLLRSSPIDLRE